MSPHQRLKRVALGIAIAAISIPTGALAAIGVMASASEGDYVNVQNYIASTVDSSGKGTVEKTDEYQSGDAMSRIVSLMSTGDAGTSKNDQLVDTGKYINIKYTFVNGDMIGNDFDLTAAANGNEDKLLDVMQGQMVSSASLYDTDGDYYVAFVTPSVMNDTDKVVSYAIARDADDAQSIDGASYDEQSGIVYLPKSEISDEVAVDAQIQLVLAHDGNAYDDKSAIDVAILDQTSTSKGINASTTSVEVNNLDIEIPVKVVDDEHAGDFSSYDFDVYVNEQPEALIPSSDYEYDQSTGTLYVSGSPVSTLSVKVVAHDHGSNTGAEAVKKAMSDYSVSTLGVGDQNNRMSGSWKTIPNVELSEIDFNAVAQKQMGVPQKYKGQANYGSIVASSMLNADDKRASQWAAQYAYVASSTERNGNLYGWIHNQGTLDNVYEDPNLGGDRIKNPGYSTSSESLYYWMSFIMSLPQSPINGIAWDEIGRKLVSGNPDVYKNTCDPQYQYLYPMLVGLCGHVSQSVAPHDPTLPKGETFYTETANLTITPMALEMEGDNPYIVIGICCGTILNSSGESSEQVGAAMYKFKIQPQKKDETGALHLDKDSTRPELTEGNPSYTLQNNEYTIWDESGNEIATLKTDIQGKASIDGLKEGWYWVHETKAYGGFKLNTTEGISYTSTDPDLPKKLEELYPDSGWYHVWCEAGDDRAIGYEGAAKVHDEPNTSNPPYLQKVDADTGEPVKMAGFEFDICSDETMFPIDHVVTNDEGLAELPLAQEGEFYVVETAVPAGSGYEVSSEKKYFTFSWGDDGKVIVEYENKKTVEKNPYLQKVDADTGSVVRMAGFKFDIKDGSGRTVKSVTTDSNGRADLTGLEPGSYTAVETAVPASSGYQLNSSPKSFTITDESDGCVVEYENERVVERNPYLQKVDAEDGMPIEMAGFEFDIKDGSGSVVKHVSTDASGRADLTGLEPGSYTAVETAVPAGCGYELDSTPKSFTITDSSDGCVVEYENQPTEERSPYMQKVDENGDPIEMAGFKFEFIGEDGSVAMTAETDASGRIDLSTLEPGRYTVKEIAVPSGCGYELSSDTEEFTLTDTSDGCVVEFANEPVAPPEEGKPEPEKGGISLTKTSELPAFTDGNDMYSLAGAVYEVYDEDGNVVAKLTTDEKGHAETAIDALYTGAYTVKEVKAPQGYKLDSTVYSVSVAKDILTSVTDPKDPSDYPVTTTIPGFSKVDGINDAGLPGAEFTWELHAGDADSEVVHTWVTRTDNSGYTSLDEAYVIDGEDAKYRDSDGDIKLPLGTMVITETKAPDGYVLSSRKITVELKATEEDGAWVASDVTIPNFPNEPARGDIRFNKIDDDGNAMGNVVFRVTSDLTGESHIIMTDEDGVYDSSVVPHRQDTNANDAAVDGDKVDESKLSSDCGTWFYGVDDGDEENEGDDVDDSRGAFPYGSYTFEELTTSATEGRNMVTFRATVERDGYLLDLGAITDNIIDIRTTATDQADGDKYVASSADAVIVDTVEYTNLNTDREYVMVGKLLDYETGEYLKDADGNDITASATFTPEEPDGSIDITFPIDASQLGGMRIVVSECLYWNDIVVAKHENIEDDAQRVEVRPEIGTEAVGEESGDHYVYDDAKAVIVDTVSYKGLVPGREYRLTGTLMNKATGDPLKDGTGNKVVAEATFTPEAADGETEVRFEFDASGLGGLDIVVFEELRYATDDGEGEDADASRIIAEHKDINDEAQTVSVRSYEVASDVIETPEEPEEQQSPLSKWTNSPLVQTGAVAGVGVAVAVAGVLVAIAVLRGRHNKK